MTSTTIQEVTSTIAGMSQDELAELYAWLEQNRPHPFDQRIAVDFAAGRLDKVLDEALEDADKGHVRPL